MKSDREFLDGIYDKAKKIDIQRETKKVMYPTFNFRYATAVFILVISPLIIYSSFKESTKIPKGYKSIVPIVRSISFDPDLNIMIEQSDLIIRGKIDEIFNSEYGEDGLLYTKIKVKQIETFKGQDKEEYLTLRIKGGIDKETKTYVEYEANFKEREDTILFLIKDDNNLYELTFAGSSKYRYLSKSKGDRIYIPSDGKKLSTNELKKLIK